MSTYSGVKVNNSNTLVKVQSSSFYYASPTTIYSGPGTIPTPHAGTNGLQVINAFNSGALAAVAGSSSTLRISGVLNIASDFTKATSCSFRSILIPFLMISTTGSLPDDSFNMVTDGYNLILQGITSNTSVNPPYYVPLQPFVNVVNSNTSVSHVGLSTSIPFNLDYTMPGSGSNYYVNLYVAIFNPTNAYVGAANTVMDSIAYHFMTNSCVDYGKEMPVAFTYNPTVDVATLPNVIISSMPSVAVNSLPSVTVSSMPSVTIDTSSPLKITAQYPLPVYVGFSPSST
jgi:hypothetical protein